MINSVEPGDEVVLIFSGHGGTSLGGASESELFYFFPADYNPATANGIDAESYVITAPEIADRLRRLRAGRVAIILDACDSGTLITPLELAAGARVTVHEVTNYFAGKPAADGESQGVLLLADAAMHQDASSGMNTNLFLDKLSDTLTAHPTGLWSTDLLNIMKEPIPVPPQFGGGFMNPSALLIGADFPISSPQ
jgi:Caspase domain